MGLQHFLETTMMRVFWSSPRLACTARPVGSPRVAACLAVWAAVSEHRPALQELRRYQRHAVQLHGASWGRRHGGRCRPTAGQLQILTGDDFETRKTNSVLQTFACQGQYACCVILSWQNYTSAAEYLNSANITLRHCPAGDCRASQGPARQV